MKQLRMIVICVLVCCMFIAMTSNIYASMVGSIETERMAFDRFVSVENSISRPQFSLTWCYDLDVDSGDIYKINWMTDEKEAIYNGSVRDISPVDDGVFFVEGNKLRKISSITNKVEEIYSHAEIIDKLDAANEIVYFISSNKLYRISPKGNSVSFLCDVKEVYQFHAVSSTKVIYTEKNPLHVATKSETGEKIQNLNSDVNYILFDSQIGKSEIISSTQYGALYDVAYDNTNEPLKSENLSGTYTIVFSGNTVPISGYAPATNETFFNKTGMPGGWVADKDDNPAIPGISACNHPGSSGSYCRFFDNGWQCWGFANYVYYRIWGETRENRHYTNGTNGNPLYFSSIARLKEIMQDVPIGSHVRVGGTNSTDGSHSFFLISAGTSYITVYEANEYGNCKVYLRRYTYEEFLGKYKYLTFYYHPCNYLETKVHRTYYHNYGNSTQHMVTCRCLNTVSYASHTMRNGTCTACGYAPL